MVNLLGCICVSCRFRRHVLEYCYKVFREFFPNSFSTSSDLSKSSIPFYFALKFILIIWLFYPGTFGAVVVYDNLITKVPFFAFKKDSSFSGIVKGISSDAEQLVNDISKSDYKLE